MNYVKLGRTGLDVSRICLGCMSYGGGDQGNHAWSLGEEESRPFIKHALEAGINFFDGLSFRSVTVTWFQSAPPVREATSPLVLLMKVQPFQSAPPVREA